MITQRAISVAHRPAQAVAVAARAGAETAAIPAFGVVLLVTVLLGLLGQAGWLPTT